MKKLFLLLLLLRGADLLAQNFGINTADPRNALHVVGNVLVTAPTIGSNAAPTTTQTITLVNNASFWMQTYDSVTRLYDPGGPSGGYLPNLVSSLVVDAGYPATCIGFEVTIESIQLGAGDSLLIREDYYAVPFLAVGNNYSTTGKWVFNAPGALITFRSNADASVGSGFSILIRRLYDNSTILPSVSGYASNSFFFDAKKGALRSGLIQQSAIGTNSNALGYKCVASGNNSVAMGVQNIASGHSSVALGQANTASGSSSVAMGSTCFATASYGLAIGSHNTASGNNATALGYFTTASGNYSTALGYYVSTNGKAGSFTIGDASTTAIMTSPAANNFRARFANGYRLYTSADYSTSCSLGAGDNAWTTTSDKRLKENFLLVDGEGILKKIALMPLTTWNYKNQDPAKFRHYGPMAQDFHAAFGKDLYGSIGSDTTINQADFAGVSFVAIQALENRSTTQQHTIQALQEEMQWMRSVILEQRRELDAVKRKTLK